MDSVEAVAVEDEFKIPLPLFDLSSPPVAIRTASALTSGGMTSWLTWRVSGVTGSIGGGGGTCRFLLLGTEAAAGDGIV